MTQRNSLTGADESKARESRETTSSSGGRLPLSPERVAIVGSRKGADTKAVVALLDALCEQQPDSIVVSGGAEGVDQLAESTWFRLGGRVKSYRPVKWGNDYGIEVWSYGPNGPNHIVPAAEQRASFADFRSAALYRDWLIAEDCDRMCVFYRRGGSPGAQLTESLARDRSVDVHVFVAKDAA